MQEAIRATYLVEVMQKNYDEFAGRSPQPEHILPVYLNNEHPDRELRLWALLQTIQEPIQVVIPVHEMFGIDMISEADAVG